MPSPIAHLAAGYVVYRAVQPRLTGETTPTSRLKTLPLLTAVLAVSLLPDIDVIPGVLTGDLGRFHNQATNSIVFIIAVSCLIGLIGRLTGWYHFRTGFMLTLLCTGLHVVMDWTTMGRGIKLFWPFSAERYSAPVNLFFGLHWSEGLVSVKHIHTVISELAAVAAVVALLTLIGKWRRNNTAAAHKTID